MSFSALSSARVPNWTHKLHVVPSSISDLHFADGIQTWPHTIQVDSGNWTLPWGAVRNSWVWGWSAWSLRKESNLISLETGGHGADLPENCIKIFKEHGHVTYLYHIYELACWYWPWQNQSTQTVFIIAERNMKSFSYQTRWGASHPQWLLCQIW